MAISSMLSLSLPLTGMIWINSEALNIGSSELSWLFIVLSNLDYNLPNVPALAEVLICLSGLFKREDSVNNRMDLGCGKEAVQIFESRE
jgi:hypothetical protein